MWIVCDNRQLNSVSLLVPVSISFKQKMINFGKKDTYSTLANKQTD